MYHNIYILNDTSCLITQTVSQHKYVKSMVAQRFLITYQAYREALNILLNTDKRRVTLEFNGSALSLHVDDEHRYTLCDNVTTKMPTVSCRNILLGGDDEINEILSHRHPTSKCVLL